MSTAGKPKDERRQAMDSALLLLKYRRRSEAEMTSRLKRKGFSDEVVQPTVARLRELGLLNDEDLARDWVRYRREAGEGERKIRQKLLERGLSRPLVDETITG